MIPKVNGRGQSFKGVSAYLMHDKDRAQTSERVSWTHTENLYTDDVEKAARFMAWTDKNREQLRAENGASLAGAKGSAGNVYHYSLSWAKSETPDAGHQKQAARETVVRLGLAEHQYFMVAHDDTDHKHVHIVVNLVNPETGTIKTPSFDKRELSTWALEYERAHGLHCEQREENAARRERGETLKHQDEKIERAGKITALYRSADSGKAFVSALEAEGFLVARGDRGRLVIVDEAGKIQNLARQVDGAKKKDIEAKLSDVDLTRLPEANAASLERREAHELPEKAAQIVPKAPEAPARAPRLEQPQPPIIDERPAFADQGHLRRIDAERETARVKAEKAEFFKQKRAEKEGQYREFYQIDERESDLARARESVARNQGVFAWLTGRKEQAAEAAWAAEMNLKDAQKRFDEAMSAIKYGREFRQNNERPDAGRIEEHDHAMKQAAENAHAHALRAEFEKAQQQQADESAFRQWNPDATTEQNNAKGWEHQEWDPEQEQSLENDKTQGYER